MSQEVLQRRLNRQVKARLEAERLLEEKSLELFDANQALQSAAMALEQQVKERTNELATALATAQAANEARGRFLAVMSHEIRTPITGLIGIIDLLQAESLAGRPAELINSAQDASAHLLSIVNGVLDLAQVEADKVSIENAELDPRRMIKSVTALLSAVAFRKGLELTGTVDDDFPTKIVSDPGRLRQILFNLVGNAIKFTVEGEVKLRLSCADGHLIVSVTDTGPGVPKEHRELIFEEFGRIGGSGRSVNDSTGLGLFITRRFARLMKGEVNVSDGPNGIGSTFRLELPLVVAEEPKDESKPSAKAEEDEVYTPRKVLVVEDTPTLQMIVASYLEQGGHQAAVASDGVEALKRLREEQFDLVLMDMMMPNMNGEETLKHIRAGDVGQANVPVLILTAAVDDAAQRLCDSGAANGALVKPVARSDLLARIEELSA
ncbi:MAG: ATP-binding protein [Pikeienuella sp.]